MENVPEMIRLKANPPLTPIKPGYLRRRIVGIDGFVDGDQQRVDRCRVVTPERLVKIDYAIGSAHRVAFSNQKFWNGAALSTPREAHERDTKTGGCPHKLDF